MFNLANNGAWTKGLLRNLLATKPEKEWVCEVCFKPFDSYFKNDILEEDICPICCFKSTTSLLDEIEEVEEVIKYKPVYGKNKGQWVSPDIGEISFVINQLIRNQKKIISYLKNK